MTENKSPVFNNDTGGKFPISDGVSSEENKRERFHIDPKFFGDPQKVFEEMQEISKSVSTLGADNESHLPELAITEKQDGSTSRAPHTVEALKSMDDHREAGQIAHKLNLLSGETSAPEMFAAELATQIAKMPQTRLNEVAKILESTDRINVQRDLSKNVVGLSVNRSTPNWNNPSVRGIDAPFYYPAVALIKGVQGIQHLARGSDAELEIGKDKVTVHGRCYFDITGKGFWRGSDELSVPRENK